MCNLINELKNSPKFKARLSHVNLANNSNVNLSSDSKVNLQNIVIKSEKKMEVPVIVDEYIDAKMNKVE